MQFIRYGMTFVCSLLFLLPVLAAEAPTGDLHLSYRFAPTGETMGYRLYVPSGYTGKKPMSLIVVLHGSGMTEDSVLDGAAGAQLKQLAQQRGYIVLAPRGYSPYGGYGSIYPVVVTRETAEAGAAMAAKRLQAAACATHSAEPSARPQPAAWPREPPRDVAVPADDYVDQAKGELSDTRTNELSEQEVLAAIEQVRQTYDIDASRIYLMGNSMGGGGAAYLAVRYPQMWAAVAPAGGPVASWSYPFWRLRAYKVPVLFVHGEFDEHSNPHWSSVLVSDALAQGADATLLVVKNGHHGDAWIMALPQIFDFFGGHIRQP